jgi:hypothetical protein
MALSGTHESAASFGIPLLVSRRTLSAGVTIGQENFSELLAAQCRRKPRALSSNAAKGL